MPEAISAVSRQPAFATKRKDRWWVEPLVTGAVLVGFVIYATFRTFENAFYEVGHLLSPFYSPLIETNLAWLSPAVLILWAPAGFRATFIMALAWGIGLGFHWFGALVAPQLRRRLVEQEVEREVAAGVHRERKSLGAEHARTLEQLSASIAHEIRNPITAAKSLVQQMGEDPSSSANVDYAKVALDELDRVERSISHLLRYAREEEMDVRDVRLPDVIDSALGAQRQIPLERAGVAGKILVRPELRGIDEDRERHGGRTRPRHVGQRQMADVQRAHRRHEPEPPAARAHGVASSAEFSHGAVKRESHEGSSPAGPYPGGGPSTTGLAPVSSTALFGLARDGPNECSAAGARSCTSAVTLWR